MVSTRKNLLESLPTELVTLASFHTKPTWTINKHAMSFMKSCITSENIEALYRKGVFDFFNGNDPTALRMIKKTTKGGHRGEEYVLVVISIFEGSISMREGLMYIANIEKTCQ
ncbi:hypothetical protein EJD97_018958 [Solanum chilense]|uniref:At2g35280-like TPR domain-containing protein n=1 Tax=Solanum chilense TaxID=4083 RepID=A0A6N2AZZ4_SOLCI|nr:hypothetical protein EJD97_018958 [Solanum chilense]